MAAPGAMETPTSGRHDGMLALALVLLVLGWLVVVALALAWMRQDALAHHHRAAAVHAHNFEDHFTQTLQVIDLTAANLELDALDPASLRALGERMGISIRPAPFIRSLSVVDGRGQVLASSNPRNVGARVGHDGFYPSGVPEVVALRMGTPLVARDFDAAGAGSMASADSASGPVLLPVLRRLHVREPLWLLAGLNPEHYLAHAMNLLDERHGHVQWLRYDGLLLMSTRADEPPGARGLSGRVEHALSQQETGRLTQVMADGRRVLTAYQSSGPYPVLVAVHIDREAVLAGWWADARRLLMVVLPMQLALLAAAGLFWRRQRQAERQRAVLSAQQRLTASVFSHAHEGIMITDANGVILDVNAAFSRITGHPREAVLGRNAGLLRSQRHDAAFFDALWHALHTQGHWEGDIWNRRRNGEVYPQHMTIGGVPDASGTVSRYVALFTDISPQKAQEAQLRHRAHHDPLTGLPNRALLTDRLHQAMQQALRRREGLAVVFMDLDGFKAVNDTHGHDLGDHLLTVLAARLQHAVREGDTVARLGGDEFVAVLLDVRDLDACTPVLERLRMAAAAPVETQGLRLQVSASLGVALFPQARPVDVAELLEQADQAMYQAKAAGRNRWRAADNPAGHGAAPACDHAAPSNAGAPT